MNPGSEQTGRPVKLNTSKSLRVRQGEVDPEPLLTNDGFRAAQRKAGSRSNSVDLI
jgi:hypothetical protein